MWKHEKDKKQLFFNLKSNSTSSQNQATTLTMNNTTAKAVAINETTTTTPTTEPTPTVELYAYPWIILIGTICNTLTFLVMRRKMHQQSTYFYMAVLAVADEIVILVGCLTFWIYAYFGQSIMFTLYGCKFFMFVFSTALHYSVWIVVIMTIERFIAVALPLQVNSFNSILFSLYKL